MIVGLILMGIAFLVIGGMWLTAWFATKDFSNDYDDWNDYR